MENKELLKEYLQQYYMAKRKVKQLEERLKEFRTDMSGIQGVQYSQMPKGSSGIGQGAAAVVMRMSEIEDRIISQKIEMKTKMLKVMEVIEFLHIDTMERAVVEYRYIDGLSWKGISDVMRMSRTPCTRYFNIGIQKLLEFPKVLDTLEKYENEKNK